MQGESPNKEPQNGPKTLLLWQMTPEQQKNHRFIMKCAQNNSFILKHLVILSNLKFSKNAQFAMTIKAKTLPNPENREKTKQKANLARNLLQGGRNINTPLGAKILNNGRNKGRPQK